MQFDLQISLVGSGEVFLSAGFSGDLPPFTLLPQAFTAFISAFQCR